MFRSSQQNETMIKELTDMPQAKVPVERLIIDSSTLLSEANQGTATVRQILSTAYEARNISVETGKKLQQQTNQLENVAMLVADTHDHLDGAEATIEKLTRPIWRRRIGRRRVEKRGMERKSGVMWKKDEKKRAVKNETAPVPAVSALESYDEFDAVIRDELKEQDAILGEASVVVEELHILAATMGEEIEKEAEIVDNIDVVEVTGRIRQSNRKLRNRLKLK